jgi:hypothetical protein
VIAYKRKKCRVLKKGGDTNEERKEMKTSGNKKYDGRRKREWRKREGRKMRKEREE